jgi:hypothetical protein
MIIFRIPPSPTYGSGNLGQTRLNQIRRKSNQIFFNIHPGSGICQFRQGLPMIDAKPSIVQNSKRSFMNLLHVLETQDLNTHNRCLSNQQSFQLPIFKENNGGHQNNQFYLGNDRRLGIL